MRDRRQEKLEAQAHVSDRRQEELEAQDDESQVTDRVGGASSDKRLSEQFARENFQFVFLSTSAYKTVMILNLSHAVRANIVLQRSTDDGAGSKVRALWRSCNDYCS